MLCIGGAPSALRFATFPPLSSSAKQVGAAQLRVPGIHWDAGVTGEMGPRDAAPGEGPAALPTAVRFNFMVSNFHHCHPVRGAALLWCSADTGPPSSAIAMVLNFWRSRVCSAPCRSASCCTSHGMTAVFMLLAAKTVGKACRRSTFGGLRNLNRTAVSAPAA